MAKNFIDEIQGILSTFELTQSNILDDVAKVIVEKIKNGGKFYVVGTGHSHMVGEEFYARAGGLACVYLIAPMELTLGEHPLKSTSIERISEYANVILMQYKVTDKDILLISSNSGRNQMPIELALQCKQRGITTIAFTSITHSKGVTSRHSCGRNLYQVCDYVIDNCGKVGDAMMEVTGTRGKMGASSSIIGVYMAQKLSMLIAGELVNQGIEPPVFLSANVDAGDSWNEDIMKKYYNI